MYILIADKLNRIKKDSINLKEGDEILILGPQDVDIESRICGRGYKRILVYRDIEESEILLLVTNLTNKGQIIDLRTNKVLATARNW